MNRVISINTISYDEYRTTGAGLERQRALDVKLPDLEGYEQAVAWATCEPNIVAGHYWSERHSHKMYVLIIYKKAVE